MVVQRQDERGDWETIPEASVFDDRDYLIFSVLAGVRNGHGFAGAPTYDPVKPIAPPRGLPRGFVTISDGDEDGDVEAASGRWLGEHSQSWLTMAEILAYDWDQPVHRCGVVNPEEYAQFKRDGAPKSWCTDVGGRSVQIISNEEMDKMAPTISEDTAPMDEIDAIIALVRPGVKYYTRIEWTRSIRAEVGEGWFDVVSSLKGLDTDPERIRIVFGFDS